MSNSGEKMLWVETTEGREQPRQMALYNLPTPGTDGRRTLDITGIRAEQLRLYGVTVRTLFARGRYTVGGMGKMRGGKHRQHLALLSRPRQQIATNRFASLCRGRPCKTAVNSGMPVQRGLSHADMTVCHSRGRRVPRERAFIA